MKDGSSEPDGSYRVANHIQAVLNELEIQLV
jgi:hypothetical protein